MKNNFVFQANNMLASIYAFAFIIIAYILLYYVLNASMWIIVSICVLIFYVSFVHRLYFIKIDELKLQIWYPLRFTKRYLIISTNQILKVEFYAMHGKATNETLFFYTNAAKYRLELEIIHSSIKKLLLFMQSRNIPIEVKFTENNSINDLK